MFDGIYKNVAPSAKIMQIMWSSGYDHHAKFNVYQTSHNRRLFRSVFGGDQTGAIKRHHDRLWFLCTNLKLNTPYMTNNGRSGNDEEASIVGRFLVERILLERSVYMCIVFGINDKYMQLSN